MHMLKAFKLIEKYLVGILVLGLIAGLLLPNIGSVFAPLIKYFLVIIMFLSFLKIDIDKLLDQFVHPAKWVYLVLISMIVVPIVLMLITQAIGLRQEIVVAVMLISAMPAAMATPALSDVFKGNTPLSIVVLLAGSILTPFIAPWLLKSFLGTQINYDFSTMMIQLAWMIFIPWILAQEVKSFFPKFVAKTMPYYTGFEIILLFFLVRGPVAQAAPYMYNNIGILIQALGWMIVISILMHLIGRNIMPKADRSEKISSTLSVAYFNLPLAIVFANSFFSPFVAVMVILYDIPWNLMLIPFKLFVDKKNKKKENADTQKATTSATTTIKKSTKRKTPKKATIAKDTKTSKKAVGVKKKTKKK